MDFPKVPEGILGEETTEKTNTELFLSLVGQYFPEAIKDGEVDFTALKEEMGEFPQVSSEHYEFTWAGKQAAKKEAMSDIYGRTLKYKPQDSLNPDTTENIYIEGDNLEALKLLRRNYHGKIKMIYIDPPYNTGSDFVYHDDFSMTEEELAEKSGDVVDGVRYQKNGKDGSRYHTNWLNMMYPRLKIARELLSDDGVIFISIGQDEISELTKMCDEVYGEINHLGTISRIMKSGGNKGRFFSPNIDYILVYGKNQTATKEFKGEMDQELIDKLYNKIETEGTRKGERYRPFGLYQSSLDERPNQRYYIECPDGSFVIPPGKTMPNTIEDAAKVLPNKGDGCWRWSQERYIEERKNGNILFTPSKSGVLIQPDGTKSQWNVYTKIWLSDRQEESQQ